MCVIISNNGDWLTSHLLLYSPAMHACVCLPFFFLPPFILIPRSPRVLFWLWHSLEGFFRPTLISKKGEESRKKGSRKKRPFALFLFLGQTDYISILFPPPPPFWRKEVEWKEEEEEVRRAGCEERSPPETKRKMRIRGSPLSLSLSVSLPLLLLFWSSRACKRTLRGMYGRLRGNWPSLLLCYSTSMSLFLLLLFIPPFSPPWVWQWSSSSCSLLRTHPPPTCLREKRSSLIIYHTPPSCTSASSSHFEQGCTYIANHATYSFHKKKPELRNNTTRYLASSYVSFFLLEFTKIT